MRRWMIGLAQLLLVLSVVKIHLMRDESGARRTIFVLQQPLALPLDSPDAYCMRHIGMAAIDCAAAFRAAHHRGLRLLSLPFCKRCGDAVLFAMLPMAGMDAFSRRIADYAPWSDFVSLNETR